MAVRNRIAEAFEDLATEVTAETIIYEDFIDLNPSVSTLPNISPAAPVWRLLNTVPPGRGIPAPAGPGRNINVGGGPGLPSGMSAGSRSGMSAGSRSGMAAGRRSGRSGRNLLGRRLN